MREFGSGLKHNLIQQEGGCEKMTRWNHVLPNSEELRKAIDEGDTFTIYEELIEVYDWAESIFSDALDYKEDIELAIEFGEFDEESVDNYLEDFWNYCDMKGIWVELR